MSENKNIPQPLDDEALNCATGGTFFGLSSQEEEPSANQTELQEKLICSRCGTICYGFFNEGTSKCTCGGTLKQYEKRGTDKGKNSLTFI